MLQGHTSVCASVYGAFSHNHHQTLQAFLTAYMPKAASGHYSVWQPHQGTQPMTLSWMV